MGKKPLPTTQIFGWKQIQVNYKAPFIVKAEDCFLIETETYWGCDVSQEEVVAHPEYMSDFGHIKWNLKIRKDISYNVGYGASALFI